MTAEIVFGVNSMDSSALVGMTIRDAIRDHGENFGVEGDTNLTPRVNDEAVDLDYRIQDGDSVRLVQMSGEKG